MKLEHPTLIGFLVILILTLFGLNFYQEVSFKKAWIDHQKALALIESANQGCSETILKMWHENEIATAITSKEVANCTTPEGNSPLHSVVEDAQQHSVKAMKLVLSYHPDMERQNGDNLTPLMLTVLRGKPMLATLLLKAGAQTNTVNDDEKTALFYARRNPEMIPLLLNYGAYPSQRDYWWETPLHEAARWGNPRAVDLLIQAGADISAHDRHGRTPLAIAVVEGRINAKTERDNAEVIAKLIYAGANPETELTEAAHSIVIELAARSRILWDCLRSKSQP